MKKILIPTDFSSIADNATHYAIEIAGAFKSKLFFYHVYTIKKGDYDLSVTEKNQPFRKKVKKEMQRMEQKFEELISAKGLTLKTKTYQGNIFSLFGRTTKKDGIDLIVMGSKGATGLKKVVFGSVAANALEMVKIPLLIVPPKFTSKSIQHIVLAVDGKDIDSDLLVPLKQIAISFGAKVTVLRINKDAKTSSSSKKIELGKIKIRHQEIPLSKNINETINKFIQKEGADMLCMVKRKKGFFKSIYKKSFTKAQAYQSQVPLLVLPE